MSIRIPYGDDGQSLVIPPPIGFEKTSDNPGGYVHNDSECTTQQSDTAMVTGGTSFWGDDSPTYDKKTKAEQDTHENGSNGAFNLWEKYVNGFLWESVQYPLDQEFTPAEVLKNEAYFGGTSAALREVGGDLITDGNGFVIFTT